MYSSTHVPSGLNFGAWYVRDATESTLPRPASDEERGVGTADVSSPGSSLLHRVHQIFFARIVHVVSNKRLVSRDVIPVYLEHLQ